MKKIISLSVLFVVVLLSGCKAINSKKVANIECSDGKVVVNVALNFDSKNFCVDIADDYKERGKGLMYLESMPDDEGMLFVFDEEDKVSFWMKNTLIPLDLLMFDENMNLLEMKDNFQPCEKEPCESYNSERKIKYVLEVNANQYDDSIVGKGFVLTISI